MNSFTTARPDAIRPESGRSDSSRAAAADHGAHPRPGDADRPELAADRLDGVRRIAISPDAVTGGVPDTASVTDPQLRIILDLSRMLAVPTDVATMLGQLAETCTRLVDCERASIFLFDAETNELWTKVAIGSKEIRLPATAGIVGAAFAENAIVQVDDPYADARFNPEPDRRTGFVTRNLLSAPMAGLDGKPMGVIQAVNKRGWLGFQENDKALIRLLSEQAGVAVQRHQLQLQAIEAVALKHEMNLARRTQEALIPKHPPQIPGLSCCGWALPASVTGGDCYDLWKLPDGRLGILLADASGHGIGPALVVSQARTLVRTLSELMADPHEILTRVNARLAEDLDWGQFVTAFLGFLSNDGTLHWSSAGHGPLLVRPDADGPLELLDPPVQPLGVVANWFDPGPEPIHIGPGGHLVLVTDGIFEASCSGEQMGVERMCEVVERHRRDPPPVLLDALRTAAREWYGLADPLDDQTVVIVRREELLAGVAPDGTA